jgi:hypothetical protein
MLMSQTALPAGQRHRGQQDERHQDEKHQDKSLVPGSLVAGVNFSSLRGTTHCFASVVGTSSCTPSDRDLLLWSMEAMAYICIFVTVPPPVAAPGARAIWGWACSRAR